jgi:hypothetical protein
MTPARGEAALNRAVSPSQLSPAELVEAAGETFDQATRAWMLRVLRWGAGAGNASLVTHLLDQIGLKLPRATVEAHGRWLAARDYVEVRSFDRVTVYELTRLGDELARGLFVDDGVATISLADVADDEFVLASVRTRPQATE